MQCPIEVDAGPNVDGDDVVLRYWLNAIDDDGHFVAAEWICLFGKYDSLNLSTAAKKIVGALCQLW